MLKLVSAGVKTCSHAVQSQGVYSSPPGLKSLGEFILLHKAPIFSTGLFFFPLFFIYRCSLYGKKTVLNAFWSNQKGPLPNGLPCASYRERSHNWNSVNVCRQVDEFQENPEPYFPRIWTISVSSKFNIVCNTELSFK